LQAIQAVRPNPRHASPAAVPDLDVTLRPDPRLAATPVELMLMLRQFKVWSGNPGFRQIAAGSGNRYSASALHAALQAGHLPRKQALIDAIVQGCGGSEEDRRMWATAWRQLAMHPWRSGPQARAASPSMARAATPATPVPAAPGQGGSCGAAAASKAPGPGSRVASPRRRPGGQRPG
jgi:hypothetical protein